MTEPTPSGSPEPTRDGTSSPPRSASGAASVLQAAKAFRPGRGLLGFLLGAGLVFVVGAAFLLGAAQGRRDHASAAGPPHGLVQDGSRRGQHAGQHRPGDRKPDRRTDGFGLGQVTISAIDGSKLTVTTASGESQTIMVADGASLTKGGQTISIADLEVGDTLRLRATRNGDGTVGATAIVVAVPHVAGTVTEVGPSGFTLRSRSGTVWTISTTATTVYMLGPTTRSSTDLAVGDAVVVAGTKASGDSLSAITVHVRLDVVAGEVTATSDTTISVKRRDGSTATIRVGSATTYRVRGVASPRLSDIKVGMAVAAGCRQAADGSLDALVVRAFARRP